MRRTSQAAWLGMRTSRLQRVKSISWPSSTWAAPSVLPSSLHSLSTPSAGRLEVIIAQIVTATVLNVLSVLVALILLVSC